MDNETKRALESFAEQIEGYLGSMSSQVDLQRLILLNLSAHVAAASPLQERFPDKLLEQVQVAIGTMAVPPGEPPQDTRKRQGTLRFQLQSFVDDLRRALTGTTGEATKKPN